MSGSSGRARDAGPGARNDTRSGEKHPSPGARLDADGPISYMYLTFDTLLLPRHDDARLPPCPDLRRLGSPLQWSAARKNMLLTLSCLATFLTAYASGAYSPPAIAMARDLGTSRLAILVGMSTFCLGFAVAPMGLAPVSEIWGRVPILVAAGAVFVVSQAACSIMPSAAGLLVARLLAGAGASVFSAVVGGVIADLWDKEDRSTPMALFSGSVMAGTGAGPLVATALVRAIQDPTLAWKCVFWHQVVLDAALVATIFFLFSESRASVLLTRRAQLLKKWCEELEEHGTCGPWTVEAASAAAGDSALAPGEAQRQPQRVRFLVREDERRPVVGKMVALSLRRPFHLLVTEPIVFFFSLWAAFSWGVLYLSISVVSVLHETDLDKASRVYVAMIVAAAAATAVSILQQ